MTAVDLGIGECQDKAGISRNRRMTPRRWYLTIHRQIDYNPTSTRPLVRKWQVDVDHWPAQGFSIDRKGWLPHSVGLSISPHNI